MCKRSHHQPSSSHATAVPSIATMAFDCFFTQTEAAPVTCSTTLLPLPIQYAQSHPTSPTTKVSESRMDLVESAYMLSTAANSTFSRPDTAIDTAVTSIFPKNIVTSDLQQTLYMLSSPPAAHPTATTATESSSSTVHYGCRLHLHHVPQ